MNKPDNVILALADRWVTEDLPAERVQEELNRIGEHGILYQDLTQALQTVLDEPADPNRLIAVATLLLSLLYTDSSPEEREMAVGVHLRTARALRGHESDECYLEEAVRHYEQARDLLEAILEDAPDDDALRLLVTLGQSHGDLAQIDADPLPHLEAEIRVWRRLQERFPDQDRRYLMVEADAHLRRGRATDAAARQHLEIALQLCRRFRSLQGISPVDYINSITFESSVLRVVNDQAQAPREHLNAALKLCEEARGIHCLVPKEDSQYSAFLIEMANTYLELSRLVPAREEYLHKVLGYCTEALASPGIPDHARGIVLLTRAQALTERLSAGRVRLAELEEAVALCGEARQWIQRSSPDYSGALMCEADALRELAPRSNDEIGTLKQLIELYDEAKPRFREVDIAYGDILLNQSIAYWQKHRAETSGCKASEALQMAEQLCQEAEQLFPDEADGRSACRRHRAHILGDMGHYRAAHALLGGELDALDSARFENEHERIQYLEVMSSEYTALVELCLEAAEQEPREYAWWSSEAWHQVHRAKRVVLDHLASPRSERVSDPGLWNQLGREGTQLDRFLRENCAVKVQERLVRSGSTLLQDLPTDYLRELQSRGKRAEDSYAQQWESYQKLRQELLERTARGRSTLAEIPSAEEVAAQLRRLARVEDPKETRPLLVEYFMLRDGQVVLFTLPLWKEASPEFRRASMSAEDLEAAVVSLVEAVDGGDPETRGAAFRDSDDPGSRLLSDDARRAADQLMRQTLEKLTPLVSSFMGPLYDEVPEAEQPTELVLATHFLTSLIPFYAVPWQGRPLIDRMPVSYLPSPALAGQISSQREQVTARWTAHGRGPALLVGNPRSGDPEIDRHVLHLPYAEEEALALEGLFEWLEHPAKAYVREEATTEQFLEKAPGAWIVHYAGHSCLTEPFWRSGLELGDRRLSLDELESRLQVPEAIMVYLSSCDSAKADAGRTEALLALARSFLYAGAPTVIASLWPVEDKEGKRFAKRLYEVWLAGGVTLAEAFQQAVREGCEHSPRLWAPFVLLGAWNTRAPR